MYSILDGDRRELTGPTPNNYGAKLQRNRKSKIIKKKYKKKEGCNTIYTPEPDGLLSIAPLGCINGPSMQL